MEVKTNEGERLFNVVYKDSTLISKDIHKSKKRGLQHQKFHHELSAHLKETTNAGHSSLKPVFQQASINYVYDGEPIEFDRREKEVSTADQDNIVIIDIKDGEKTIGNISSLSPHWQVNGCDESIWEFNDSVSGEKSIVTNILLKGTQSELIVEDDTINDLKPKNDLEYVSKLVGLFIKRNEQLNNTIDLYKDEK
ncbi:hypothetical protein CANARDRAFT_30192 [[Candida] arabinofermentans NRRL YB-2248]|uniref:Uncharacterized protein n=1 Tax=[Candida] arabinofermentans NRRL YB-2248 TaxID=983967 RepID=A0A1E4SUR8_9ASCO|nr:hypothetical protein CANARDRAFT_30192 [[Candida] arabinofermentans NRRL YB-2248]